MPRHCDRKLVFETKEEAEQAARDSTERYGKKFGAYRCLVHGGLWHIGRSGHGRPAARKRRLDEANQEATYQRYKAENLGASRPCTCESCSKKAR